MSDAPQALDKARTGRDSYFAFEGLVSPNDLTVVFQPIVSLEDGKLFAYEALVRCGLLALQNPMVLFERAVQVGCAGRLGRMIREIAVPLSAGKPIFLNVHPQELHEAWIVRPDDPIFSHDHTVFLEVTESMPLTHHELCMNVLGELRARANIELVVDDLGAGYSNLKRILDLEPKVVKLDRGLIMNLDKSVKLRPYLCLNFVCRAGSSGLTPMTRSFCELKAVRLSRKSQASAVQPGVSSFG